MSTIAERIRNEVRQLPFAERAHLVNTLEADLDNDEATAPGEIDSAWEAEESSRVHEVMNDRVKLLTSADLQRRLDEVRARHRA